MRRVHVFGSFKGEWGVKRFWEFAIGSLWSLEGFGLGGFGLVMDCYLDPELLLLSLLMMLFCYRIFFYNFNAKTVSGIRAFFSCL